MGKVTEKIRPNLFFFKRAADHFEMRFKNKRFCGSWDECETWLREQIKERGPAKAAAGLPVAEELIAAADPHREPRLF